MAVSNPIISAGATTTRSRAAAVVVAVSGVEPPGERRYINSEGDLVIEAQTPEREGQMLVYRPSSTKLASLYVVVNIDGVLTWVQAQTRSAPYDAATGKPWDPLADRYSILAY